MQVATTSTGWKLTVYYTPVESFHSGPSMDIVDCDDNPLGSHPEDFLSKVQVEGYGRLTTPIGDQHYLGWDFDRRCWFLATDPLDAQGVPLQPWSSVAASPDIPFGTVVRIKNCGPDLTGAVCDKVRAAKWIVSDRGGAIGDLHLDLYYGEEDQANFESSPYYFDAQEATVTI